MGTTVQIGKTWTVDLDDLTPKAAALARLWSCTLDRAWIAIELESDRTMREMGGTEEEAALWGWDLDEPHRIVWDVPTTKPGGPHPTPEQRLEALAQAMPIGYIPVAMGEARLTGEQRDAALADLITRDQVVQVLRDLGRALSPQTITNYTSRPAVAPAGWPQPVRHIGRTPVWSRHAVEAYARD